MKNYADMSDFEINVEVANAIYGSCEKDDRNGCAVIRKKAVDILGYDAYYSHHADYCNNWADAGPVMLENKISITTQSKGKWFCYFDDEDSGFECSDKNPLRAAMIVFLMMKDNETRILAPDEVSDE